jgi:hypothetical protein
MRKISFIIFLAAAGAMAGAFIATGLTACDVYSFNPEGWQYDGASVTKMPHKVEYYEGAHFNASGLEITLKERNKHGKTRSETYRYDKEPDHFYISRTDALSTDITEITVGIHWELSARFTFPITVKAFEQAEFDGFTVKEGWEPLKTGQEEYITLSIIGYSGTDNNVTIPSEMNGRPITIIGYAFQEKRLTGVTIPNSIKRIENSAFYGNRLTSVTIPNGVTYIGDGAFADNQLTSVTIPNSVTYLSGFEGNHLTSVTIPGSVTDIGDRAFANNQLTRVTIPNGVTSIRNGAFDNNQLTSVTIPNNVINLSGFEGNHLTRITIPNGVTSIGERAFYGNQLTSVTIPDKVTDIGDRAFYNNRLTSVTILNSCTIGEYAFSNNRLAGITLKSNYIWSGAFSNNPLTSITIGANATINSGGKNPTNPPTTVRAFPGDFDIVYFNNTYSPPFNAAGTYTRPDDYSETWTKQ